MVVVSYSGKEINAKLVYYGAGLSGKTTNLESIYEAVPDTSRGKMVSMKTQSDRTLFFDLLPLDLGEIMGFKTRFLLYTVPGQVFYNATRKLVLKGADAIVFVADSEVGKMEENKESLANLMANLAEYGLSIETIPWVIQYNKRDLPNVYSLDELNAELNPGGKVPFFEAVATQGKGVFETFRGISHLLMEKVTRDLRRGPGSGGSKPLAQAPSAATSMPAAPSPVAASPVFQTQKPVEPPKPVEAVRPSGSTPVHNAAPGARGMNIEHEAQAADMAALDGVDYGREIELPGQAFKIAAEQPVPAEKLQPEVKPEPAARAEAVPQAATPQPAPVVSKSEQEPAMAKSAQAPAPKPFFAPASPSTTQAGAPKQAVPEPVASRVPPAGPSAPAAHPQPVAVATAKPEAAVAPPAPAARTEPHTSPTVGPSLGPSARGGQAPATGEAGTEAVVVPIRIPKGSSREIVLRIIISAEDDAQV